MSSVVYNIDNIEGIKAFPDKHFELSIVDPVYGIDGNSHRKNKSRGRLAKSKDYHPALWDQKITGPEYFEELKRVSKNYIVFGGNYFDSITEPFPTPRRHNVQEFLETHPTGWILWDKINGTTGFNDYEMIYTSFDRPTIIFPFMWNGFMQVCSIVDGTRMNPHKDRNEIRIHPTQKPVLLYKWILNDYANPGDKILDTHVGSGSLRIACHDLGFDFTGFEIVKAYFYDEERRFKNHIAQQKLFA